MTIQTKEIEYQVNGETFIGFFAVDDQLPAAAPGILLVHEWWGRNNYVIGRAKQLAEEGFAAFAVDMYGAAKVAADPEEAGKLMADTVATDGAIVQRFDAAMQVFSKQTEVDQQNLSAMGYCFGGAVVLGMARAGKPLKLVASFHGALQTDTPLKGGRFDGEILVFNGAADPLVPEDIVRDFKDEMAAANANCSFTNYPGVLHGFTNPAATAKGQATGMPLAYDEHADTDSYSVTVNRIRAICS